MIITLCPVQKLRIEFVRFKGPNTHSIAGETGFCVKEQKSNLTSPPVSDFSKKHQTQGLDVSSFLLNFQPNHVLQLILLQLYFNLKWTSKRKLYYWDLGTGAQ